MTRDERLKQEIASLTKKCVQASDKQSATEAEQISSLIAKIESEANSLVTKKLLLSELARIVGYQSSIEKRLKAFEDNLADKIKRLDEKFKAQESHRPSDLELKLAKVKEDLSKLKKIKFSELESAINAYSELVKNNYKNEDRKTSTLKYLSKLQAELNTKQENYADIQAKLAKHKDSDSKTFKNSERLSLILECVNIQVWINKTHEYITESIARYQSHLDFIQKEKESRFKFQQNCLYTNALIAHLKISDAEKAERDALIKQFKQFNQFQDKASDTSSDTTALDINASSSTINQNLSIATQESSTEHNSARANVPLYESGRLSAKPGKAQAQACTKPQSNIPPLNLDSVTNPDPDISSNDDEFQFKTANEKQTQDKFFMKVNTSNDSKRIKSDRKSSVKDKHSLTLEMLLTAYISCLKAGKKPKIQAHNGSKELVNLFYAYAYVLKEAGLNMVIEDPNNLSDKSLIESNKIDIAKRFNITLSPKQTVDENITKELARQIISVYLVGDDAHSEQINSILTKIGHNPEAHVSDDINSPRYNQAVKNHGIYFASHSARNDNYGQTPRCGGGKKFNESQASIEAIEDFCNNINDSDVINKLNSIVKPKSNSKAISVT